MAVSSVALGAQPRPALPRRLKQACNPDEGTIEIRQISKAAEQPRRRSLLAQCESEIEVSSALGSRPEPTSRGSDRDDRLSSISGAGEGLLALVVSWERDDAEG